MKTALIVDDQANVRCLICDYLSQEGFHVIEAGDGRAVAWRLHICSRLP